MRWRTRGLLCLMLSLGAVSIVGCVEPDDGESATYGVQEHALSEDAGLDALALDARALEPQLAAAASETSEQAVARTAAESHTPFELPPIDGADWPAPQRKYFVDLCPNDKPLRADWAELEASKVARGLEQANSAEEATAMAELISELSSRKVPAEVVQKQQEYLAAVAARQRELDGLPAAERAQTVAELKESMLGRNVDE